MVDLPGPPQNVVALNAPRSSVTRSEIEEPYTELASNLKQFGEVSQDAANSLAKQAGLRAVTLDENGNIKVDKFPIIGEASKYFADAVKIGALAQGEGLIRRKDIELRQQFRDDPQGYLKAATAFSDGIQKQWTEAAGPELGFAIRKTIEPITTQTFRSLLNEHERLQLARSVGAINAEIETTKNQMYAMARGGITAGPEWDRANAKIKTLYDTVVSNPRLAYPREKADFELSQFNSELKVQGLSHHVAEVYNREGYDAALKTAQSIRTDASLNLSPQQRDVAFSRVVSELNGAARDDERMVKGIATQIQSVEGLALQGYAIPSDQIAGLRDQVQAAKRPELDAALATTSQIVDTMRQWRTLSAPQLEQVLDGLDKTIREKGATDIGTSLYAAGQKLLTQMRTQVGKDPLGWADRTGVMAVPPIQWGGQDQLSQMSDRASRAETIAQHYGVAPTYLRPDEKHAL